VLVLLALSVLGFGGLSANALPDDKPADRTTDSAKPDKGRDPRLEALWKDLASAEESKATRALLLLTTTPKETVALLKTHLRPVKVEPEQVARLVADLDSPKF
jgi:hypothetical protein